MHRNDIIKALALQKVAEYTGSLEAGEASRDAGNYLKKNPKFRGTTDIGLKVNAGGSPGKKVTDAVGDAYDAVAAPIKGAGKVISVAGDVAKDVASRAGDEYAEYNKWKKIKGNENKTFVDFGIYRMRSSVQKGLAPLAAGYLGIQGAHMLQRQFNHAEAQKYRNYMMMEAKRKNYIARQNSRKGPYAVDSLGRNASANMQNAAAMQRG